MMKKNTIAAEVLSAGQTVKCVEIQDQLYFKWLIGRLIYNSQIYWMSIMKNTILGIKSMN